MDIFTKLKGAIKLREVYIDHEIFRLHYKVTSLMLLGSSFLVASRQHFGDPIDCMSNDDLGGLLDTYCWIHSTFVIASRCNSTIGVDGNPHPCIEKYTNGSGLERRHQNYYQWIYFVLFFQAALFYAPHFYWKMREKKLLTNLAGKLRSPLEKDEHTKQVKTTITYLAKYKGYHQGYFFTYVGCEIFNLINVISQIFLVDKFLGGAFVTYGFDVLRFVMMEQEDRFDPMIQIFPHMTKCTFHKFGSSGDVQKHDSLCILPLNIINEKIYVIMWFWFVILGILSAIWIIYRLMTIVNPALREHILNRRANMVERKIIHKLVANIKVGDWFLLSMLSKNIDSHAFKNIADGFLSKIENNGGRKKESKRREETDKKLDSNIDDTQNESLVNNP